MSALHFALREFFLVLLFELADAVVTLLNELLIDLQMESFPCMLFAPLFLVPWPRGSLLIGSDEAELRIVDDFFNRLRLCFLRVRPGHVVAGYLKAIEQKAGAARIDLIGEDEAQNFSERELEGGAVRGVNEGKLIAFLFALARILDGRAVFGVVVAEVLAAQRPRAATPPISMDMAA